MTKNKTPKLEGEELSDREWQAVIREVKKFERVQAARKKAISEEV